jgi:hypothetical protein
MMSVPCCVLDDVDRFVDLISAAIDSGDVEKFRQFPSSRYGAIGDCFIEFQLARVYARLLRSMQAWLGSIALSNE